MARWGRSFPIQPIRTGPARRFVAATFADVFDDFDRAPGLLGFNWSTIGGEWEVNADRAEPDHDFGFSFTYWDYGPATPANQFAEAEIVGSIESQLNKGPGPAVRMSGAAPNAYTGYGVAANNHASGGFQLFRAAAGSLTWLANYVATPVAGDVVRIGIFGTTIYVWVNDVLRITYEDSNVATGRFGMVGQPWNAWGNLDNFHGGVYTSDPGRPRILSVGGDEGFSQTLTVPHTFAGNYALVRTNRRIADGNTITGVTLGGTPMDLVSTRGAGNSEWKTWELVNPPAGLQDVESSAAGFANTRIDILDIDNTVTATPRGTPEGNFESGVASNDQAYELAQGQIAVIIGGVEDPEFPAVDPPQFTHSGTDQTELTDGGIGQNHSTTGVQTGVGARTAVISYARGTPGIDVYVIPINGPAFVPSGTIYEWTATGGIQSGGSAGVAVRRAVVAAGGLQSAGVAPVAVRRAVVATGGITVAGAAPSLQRRAWVASGGLQSAGAATTSTVRAFVWTATGGLQSGGTAGILARRAVIGSGGLQSGGAALLRASRSAVGAGGIQSGGSGTVRFGVRFSPTGGFQSGGAATTSFGAGGIVYAYTATGGITAAGAGSSSRRIAYAPTGGIVTGGAATSRRIAAYVAAGGLVSAGAAGVSPTWRYVPTGGIVAGGAATTEQVDSRSFDVVWLSAPRVHIVPRSRALVTVETRSRTLVQIDRFTET